MSYDVSKNEILAFVKEGKTDKEIAGIIHTSEETVRRYRWKYGIHKSLKSSFYDKAMYLRMKEVGLTDEQIAYIWGSKRRNLNKWKHREGLTVKRAAYSSKNVISNVENNNIERRNKE